MSELHSPFIEWYDFFKAEQFGYTYVDREPEHYSPDSSKWLTWVPSKLCWLYTGQVPNCQWSLFQ